MERIFSAKTLDDAKNAAITFFKAEGGEEKNISFEILEQPVKKLFGLKGEYKIRAILEEPEDIAVPVIDSSPQSDESTNLDISGKYSGIISYVTKILNALGTNGFKINVIEKPDIIVFDITGENLGIAIGRRGETLDSLQYLTILANNRMGEQYTRISLDCNGYREKRRETLESLAKRTASKVIKQSRRITLEPMNPYERRIIHSTVSEIEGVYSNSVGDEPYRKVVISASNPKFKSNDRRNGSLNKNKDRNVTPSGRSYKQSSGFSTSFEREYKRTNDVEISNDTVEVEKSTSLYGKIEL